MDPDDLAFAGIARQAELVRSGAVSARELVELSLARIERLNPRLNAVRPPNAARALADADEADRKVARGEVGPLLGVPVLVKDDTDVEGEVTAWGSAAFPDPADADAPVVRRLRAAGAVVVAKTTLPELAICGFTESVAYGVTRSPWSLEHTPGGSSGGSAAAVAAGIVGLATGSDGAGSIRIPAAFCGLFGLKPQTGRVPAAEHWYGLSSVGCLSRTVLDTALFLDVATDREHGPAVPARPFVDAVRQPRDGLRIGVATTAFRTSLPAPVHPDVRRALTETAALLGELGHQVRDVALRFGTAPQTFSARFMRGIHDHAAAAPHPGALEGRTRGIARLGALVPARAAAAAQRGAARDAARVNAVFDDLDVVMTPVVSSPPVRVGRWEGASGVRTVVGMGRVYCFTPPWNHTGQPAASVPAGFTADGLPLAVQLIARPDDEATLLSLAAQLEQARPWADRRPPVR